VAARDRNPSEGTCGPCTKTETGAQRGRVCGCVGVWVCGGGWGDPFEGSILLPYPTGVHALEAEEPLFVAEDDRAEGGVGPYHVQRGPDAWKWPQS